MLDRPPRRRRPPRRQAGGRHLARRRRRRCGARCRAGAKVGHAGTLDPFATGLLLVLVGPGDARAAVPDGAAEDLPRGGAARLDAPTPATATASSTQTGRVPERLEIPTGEQLQRPPAYSAVKVGGERAYEQARRGEPPEGEPRPVTVHRAELLWRRRRAGRVRDRVLVGHLRAPAGRRPRRRLLRGARAHARSGRSGSPTPTRAARAARRGARVPARAAALRRARPGASRHGRRRRRRARTRGPRVRLTHDGELLAIGRAARAASSSPS